MFLRFHTLGMLLASLFFVNECTDPRSLALYNWDLFGGDMIVDINEMLRNGIVNTKYRWPGYPGSGKIPYVIAPELTAHTDLILRAMEQYNKLTCVKFVPRKRERDYVRILKDEGCWSFVGRNASMHQPQPLSLGDGCYSIGTIVHELGHTVGFFHEQNRSDRDTYLDIYLENVDENKRHNFKKLEADENILLNNFDYISIMIYGNKAFSNNGKDTMVAKNGENLTNPYEKPGLDNSDIERVNKLYKCKPPKLDYEDYKNF